MSSYCKHINLAFAILGDQRSCEQFIKILFFEWKALPLQDFEILYDSGSTHNDFVYEKRHPKHSVTNRIHFNPFQFKSIALHLISLDYTWKKRQKSVQQWNWPKMGLKQLKTYSGSKIPNFQAWNSAINVPVFLWLLMRIASLIRSHILYSNGDKVAMLSAKERDSRKRHTDCHSAAVCVCFLRCQQIESVMWRVFIRGMMATPCHRQYFRQLSN